MRRDNCLHIRGAAIAQSDIVPIKDPVVAVVPWEMLVYQLIEIFLDSRFHSFVIGRVEPDSGVGRRGGGSSAGAPPNQNKIMVINNGAQKKEPRGAPPKPKPYLRH